MTLIDNAMQSLA